MNLQDIKNNIRKGNPVSHAELAWAIGQDKHMLFNMLMDNNLASVNKALRIDLNQKYLSFAPDRKAIEAVVNAYIVKNDLDSLNVILRDFEADPNAANYTGEPAFLLNLKSVLR
jgi:hypothetical protein